MATRKMTDEERKQYFEQLLAYENARSESEERKSDVVAEFNKEIKGHDFEINRIR